MKESFKKIWTDPVWSKIISVGIIGIFSYTVVLIGKYFLSDCQKLALIESFEKIINIKISIIYVLAILVANWIFFWLLKKIKKKKPLYNKKQLKLMEYNNMAQPETGLLFKWVVCFDKETPFIAELNAYCTKHGEIPVRLMEGTCIIPNCKNSRRAIMLHGFKNLIESELIHKWDKLK